ncbi:PREDICTED: 5-hydroxytryptamine receptor-like [Acropora digitifera]|uniref:5-hydroxytryptamine receptor-like n=1 Tax=Acropora digitifera TaxID=70779 RepID=UPI00077B1C90|nr:PREDICTED: 5-hydroxytryptamine receptor-like [Acropora digitifera]
MAENINLVLEVVFLSVICAISLLGNITLVAIFLRKRVLRTVANGFLLNLAFADLLVSVLNMPVTVVTIIERRWIFGETACNFLGFTTMLSFVSSVMSLAMIAVNRYYFVVKWKTYRSVFTPRNSVIFGAIVWLISSSISIPPLFGWADYRYIPGKSYCFVLWPCSASYMYFMLAICFFGPLIVMSLSYYHILKFTREAKRRIFEHGNTTQPQEQGQRRNRVRFLLTPEEVKLTNTLLIVVGCFMICWTPFAITMFTDIYYVQPLPRPIDISTLLLGYANSMCNPVVYGVRTQVFRRELIRQLRVCFRIRSASPRISPLDQGIGMDRSSHSHTGQTDEVTSSRDD